MPNLRLRAMRPAFCAAVVLLLFHAAAEGAALFTGTFDYPAIANPESLAAGDVDGDGDPDLVTTAYFYGGAVAILLNDGAGAFGLAPGSPLPGIRFPISAEFGQFDPDVDRNLDLVVVSYVSYGVSAASMFLGDGSGGFRLANVLTLHDVGSIGRKAAVADYDGDGRDDLACSDGEVLLGSGGGMFVPAPPVPVGGVPAFDVISGDWNGDSRPDLAFIVPQSSMVRIFLAGAGGAFTEAAASPVALSGFTETLAAGDFDGDGDLDLAATDFDGQRVFVVRNDGRGSFAIATTIPVRAGYPRGIAAADFDGDGRADLAVGSNNSSDLSVLLASGGGEFVEIDESPLMLTAGVPVSIVARDLDGDDRPDLVAVDFWGGGVAVFLNISARVVQVAIDIMPGSDQNVIRLGARGVLPVAILGAPDFDARMVAPASVRLAGAPVRTTASGALLCQSEDVDHDSIADLLCHIENEGLRLTPDDTTAVLEGVTFDGTLIEGRDTVRVLAAR